MSVYTTTRSIVFTRVEESHIGSLSPNALRSLVISRSYAGRNGLVKNVYQQQMADRAGVSRRQFLNGMQEAIAAGAMTKHREGPRRVSYSFYSSDSRFAAIPNEVLNRAVLDLQARDLQVLINLYLHTDSLRGITWVSTKTLADRLGMDRANVSRSLRRISQRNLVRRCTDDCVNKRPHWHLATHLNDHNPCATEDTEEVSPAAHQTGTEEVSHVAHPCRPPNNQQTDRKPGNTRAGRAMSHREDDLPAVGGDVFAPRSSHRPKKRKSESSLPSVQITERFIDRIRMVKPGIHLRQQERMIMYRWINERLATGWTQDGLMRAVDSFMDDPKTRTTLQTMRPWKAFFAYAKHREATFTETVDPHLEKLRQQAVWEG